MDTGRLRAAHRQAYLLGLSLCVGTPVLVAALMLSGGVPAGEQRPEGAMLQVGTLFTGLVFLGGAWCLWRFGRVLAGFRSLAPERRPGVVLREILVASAILEASCLLGLAWWALVGAHAARQAWAFVALSPGLFLALVPRASRWERALEG